MSKAQFQEVDLGDFRAGMFHFQKTAKMNRVKAETRFNRTTFFDKDGNELGRQFKHRNGNTQCQATRLLQPHIAEAQKEGVKFFLKEDTYRKAFSTRERMGLQKPTHEQKVTSIESARQAT